MNVILTICVVPTQEEETDKMIRNPHTTLRNVEKQDSHRVCARLSWLVLSAFACVPSSPANRNEGILLYRSNATFEIRAPSGHVQEGKKWRIAKVPWLESLVKIATVVKPVGRSCCAHSGIWSGEASVPDFSLPHHLGQNRPKQLSVR